MKKPSPAERQHALSAFVEFDEPFGIQTVDRSTLENYATCPAQARFRESGRVWLPSKVMAIGNEVHQAFSTVVTNYVRAAGGILTAKQVRDEIYPALHSARPDLQPEVIRAARPAIYQWAQFLAGINHDNILRYDGGEGARSGQLAWDLPGLPIRLTSEIDFLHTSPSAAVLRESDYKSGWTRFTVDAIRDSFQFQFHAWLVLRNYAEPDVPEDQQPIQCLEVTIWRTRTGERSYPVQFHRHELPVIETRLRSAAAEYLKWQDRPAEKCATWPTQEKCELCPAALLCPAADETLRTVETDPGGMVDWLVATEARCTAVKRSLARIRTRDGQDIVSPLGNAYGQQKPSSGRAKPNALYSLTETGGEAEEASCDS